MMLSRENFEKALKTLQVLADFPGKEPKVTLKVTRGMVFNGKVCDHAVVEMTGDPRHFNEAVGGMLTMSASIIGGLLTASTVDGVATWTISISGEPAEASTTDEVADRVISAPPKGQTGPSFPGALRPRSPADWVFCGVSRALSGEMFRWVHQERKVRVVSAITADRKSRIVGVANGDLSTPGSRPSPEQIEFAKAAFGVEGEVEGEILGIVQGSADDCAAWFTMTAGVREAQVGEVLYDASAR